METINHAEKGLGLIASQYSNSPKFKEYLKAFLDQATEVETALGQLLNERDLENAEGEQLDVIGRIVGLARFFINTTGDEFGNILLNDEDYRTFLRAKILKNHTRCLMPQMTEIYTLIFNAPCQVKDGPGVMYVYVGKPLTPFEKSLFTLKDKDGAYFVPKPLGIRLFGFSYDPNNYFGFAGDPNAKGFNVGKFAGVVG